MYQIDFYKVREGLGELSQVSIKRNWMDETYDAHAYKCFPVSLTNGLGWGISFPEDISFIWDGISDSTPDHVKILKGEKYAHVNRGNATISFNSGIMFRTPENMSMLGMPVPNQVIAGAVPFSTLISTSFFKGEFPIAWRLTEANKEITIPAGTPVISVVPISLTELNNSEMILRSMSELPAGFWPDENYSQIVYELNKQGKWSNFYRDAVDHKGDSIGNHEVKALRLKVIEGPRMCNE